MALNIQIDSTIKSIDENNVSNELNGFTVSANGNLIKQLNQTIASADVFITLPTSGSNQNTLIYFYSDTPITFSIADSTGSTTLNTFSNLTNFAIKCDQNLVYKIKNLSGSEASVQWLLVGVNG